MSKVIKRMIIFIILLAIIFWLFRIVKIQDNIQRRMYPVTYQTYVEQYAEENNVDKYMIYAIIKAESNFKPEAKSRK